MTRSSTRRVAFISSFPPMRCGIATFTSDLVRSVSSAGRGQFQPLVVAIRSDEELRYENPVKFEVRQSVKSDYISAADYINFSHVDVVSAQHEFGLFGGEAGSYLSLLLTRLNAPVITTLHTVLDNPTPAYHKSLVEVCNSSYKVITMNERGVGMLTGIYGVSPRKIELIPHGIPDLPFVDSNYYKHKFGMEGRRTILTFGLLSRNKGIEVMLEALPAIIKAEPSAVYIVLGMTHPAILKQEGESYRYGLQRMVKELGLQEHVIFHNRFVSDEELENFLCAADVYVTPYHNREQLTSGTLSFAVGAGKAVVSTPYWAAEELLADGRGKLAGFADSHQIAEAIIEILRSDSLFYSMRRRSYDYGRPRTWLKIGHIYWKLFGGKRLPAPVVARAAPSAAERVSSIELPEPSLVYLKKITDDTGLYQHARFTIPRREHGYTTDDNARAVIAVTRYYAQHPEPQTLELLDLYLSFILHAQNSDGTVRNFMSFDRTWRKDEPVHDALGRFLWALGSVMAQPPSPCYLSVIKDCFDNSVKHVDRQHPRGMAYSILGMSDYLKQFPGASDIKRQLETAADGLMVQYKENGFPDWRWFEDVLTYDNGVLPHALFAAGLTLGARKYLKVAEQTCEFLLAKTFGGNHFSFVGCNGWYERGGTKAAFDQQPIEAASTIMMLRAAYDVAQDSRFLTLQRKAFDWFLGVNDLHTSLYDFRTGGCCDALMAEGVNINQGAESIVSFVLSLLAVLESYTILDRIKGVAEVSVQEAKAAQQKVKEPTPIKSISAKRNSKKKEVEEPAVE
ncbi:MAG TPA: glycosyltransferase family 4 protein [Sedimentisphaerales bacterium]|nr:glycosyltransferase family 4 protein [Sedimentisphaerales bacterium]